MGLNVFQSKIGPITVESLQGEIIAIRFKQLKAEEIYPDDTTEACIAQLKAYFNGTLKRFTVPYKLVVTDYQESVLNCVSQIPYGSVRSYLQVAQLTGGAEHVRSVGAANAKNPIPIIIPCHRVIGVNGKLVGYVGGLSIKKWLIQHENSSKQLSLF